MNKAEKIIYDKAVEIMEKFPSGEKFFDELDRQLNEFSPNEVLLELFTLIPKGYFIVLSGKFGKKVAELIDNGTIPYQQYFLFEGGIRKGAKPNLIRMNTGGNPLFRGIFLDDSIYGGATYRALQGALEHILDKCAVIYDGCPVVREDISAIFRYYDHFPETKPNYEF